MGHGLTQGMLRLCSGMLTSARVKAAATHVRRLNWNRPEQIIHIESMGALSQSEVIVMRSAM